MNSIQVFGGLFFLFWLGGGLYIYYVTQSQEKRILRIRQTLSSYVKLPKKEEEISVYVFSNKINSVIHYFLYKILNYKSAESSIKNNRAVFAISFFILSMGFVFIVYIDKFILFAIWPFVWLFLFRFFYTWVGKKYLQKLYNQLPETIGMLVRDLRVGMPLSRAVQLVSNEASEPTASEFRKVMQDVAVGASIPGAFTTLSDRIDLEEYKLVSIVVNLQAESGGTMADIMASLEKTLRNRMEIRKKALAASSEAKMTSYILLGLPIAVGVFLQFGNPHYFDKVLYTPNGNIVLALAVGLWFAGLISIKVLISKVLGQ
ncbi:MAG: type II secretion system F family protein [Acetobacter sp.]